MATKLSAVASSASVGTASAQVLAANPNRKGLLLINTSTNTIYISFDGAAVVSSGIMLVASGGAFSMNESSLDCGVVNAIASAAASNLSIEEFSSSSKW